MPPRKRRAPARRNPPLSIADTRRRIAAVAATHGFQARGRDGWDIFERGDGEWSIQVDDEFWSDTPRDERVTDEDVAQLPEAQTALAERIAATSGDQPTLEDRVIAALNLDASDNDAVLFAEEIIRRVQTTVPMDRFADYATSDPALFREIADDRLREFATLDTEGRRPTWEWQRRPGQLLGVDVVEDVAEGFPSGDEAIARVAISQAMGMDPAMTPDERVLATNMISRVARHMASFGAGTDWERIVGARRSPDFKQQVYLSARYAGLGAVDASGRQYSLERPPAFWEYRGEDRGRVPIIYQRPAQLEPLEIAIATALDLDMAELAMDPEPPRDFIADVWEYVLVDPATPDDWKAGIVSDPALLRERVQLAARRAAEDWQDVWVWTTRGRAGGGGNITYRITKRPPGRAVGMPPPERIPEEAREIAAAMTETRPAATSGSPAMPMIRTSGGRGSYPQEITQVVSNFSDTSYGNDVTDSVQFSIGNVGYRLWVNTTNESDRNRDASEFRYSIVFLDRPTPTATLQQVLDEGTPGPETIFETDYPAELIAYIRRLDDQAPPERPARSLLSGTDTSELTPTLRTLYELVLARMQPAEESSGPEGEDYVTLMSSIADIASSRVQNLGSSIGHEARWIDAVTTGPAADVSREVVLNIVLELGDAEELRITGVISDDQYRAFMRTVAAEARRRAEIARRIYVTGPLAGVPGTTRISQLAPVGRAAAPTPPDMHDVRGQPDAVAAAEEAVATHRNLLLMPARSSTTYLAERIPTIMPRVGGVTPPFRAPHHSIVPAPLGSTAQQRTAGIAELLNSARLAAGGVLFLNDVIEFNTDGLRALTNEMRTMSNPPLIVASSHPASAPPDEARINLVSEILNLQIRAAMQSQPSATAGAPAEDSAIIRARILARINEPEDIMGARFKQLELKRAPFLSPSDRSSRLSEQFHAGTRITVIHPLIRPPAETIPRGATGTVTYVDAAGRAVEVQLDRPIPPDAVTTISWGTGGSRSIRTQTRSFETLASDIEIEAESAERFRMIEMNPKNNPAWVTSLLSKHFEFLEDKVPAKWLPKLKKVTAKRGKLTAAMKEYGCGSYGCVLPTLDPKVVLKVTTDDTEYQFAAELAGDLAAQVTVVYHLVAGLPEKHRGRFTYLLWRDSAERVGELDKVVGENGGDPELVEHAIDVQHKAAQQVYIALMDGEPALDLLEKWKAAARAMGQSVPELAELVDGMIINLDQNRVFFGDVHAGNIGMVGDRWLVVDPGNIAVLEST